MIPTTSKDYWTFQTKQLKNKLPCSPLTLVAISQKVLALSFFGVMSKYIQGYGTEESIQKRRGRKTTSQDSKSKGNLSIQKGREKGVSYVVQYYSTTIWDYNQQGHKGPGFQFTQETNDFMEE